LYYVPLAVFSEPLIAIWIDAPSAAAATPLVWAMLPGSVAYLLGSSLENTLLKARGIVFQPMLVHAAMLLALVLGLAMLPRWYGLAGVGWAHSLANGVFLLGIVLLVTWRGRPR
jgi:hypothetical protein